MPCRSERSGLIERAIAGVHRVVPAGQSGFPNRCVGVGTAQLPGPASWIVAAVAVVVFMAVLIAARDLLVPIVLLVWLADGPCGPSAGSLARSMGGPMMHLVLVIAVVIILAASCLLTFALCRAATRRDMLEARWREESAGSVGEESHESA